MTEKKKLDIQFTITGIEEKPNRKYRKGSKYDPLIESALEQLEAGNAILKVNLAKGIDANYVRTQLAKRITAKELTDVMVASVVNNELYISEVTEEVETE